MSAELNLGFEDGVAIDKTWSNEKFIEEFKNAHSKLYNSLKSLFESSFGKLSFDDYAKPFEESKIDMHFKDPESGQVGTVCALKVLDIPMIDLGSFEERSNGKVDNLSSFIARANAMYFGKIVESSKRSLENMDERDHFRIFVKYGKTENEHFQLFLICNGIETDQEGVIYHYTDEQLKSFQFEDNLEINNVEGEHGVDFDKCDTHTYNYPIGDAKIVESPIPPTNESVSEALNAIFTDKLSEGINNAFELLSKKYFGTLKHFRRVTIDDLSESPNIEDLIHREIRDFTIVDSDVYATKDGNKFSEWDIVLQVVWGEHKDVRLVKISALVPSIGNVDKSGKFVITSINDLYQYFDDGKQKKFCVSRYTVAKWDYDKPTSEFWKDHGYEMIKIRKPEKVETRFPESEIFNQVYEYNGIARDTKPLEAPNPETTLRPEYVKVDIDTVSSRLGSVVNGLNRMNHSSMVYDKQKLSPTLAAKEVTLGVLHGLNADETDPSYVAVKKSADLITKESAAIKSIRLVCESSSIVGKGTIKFVGELYNDD